MLLQPSPAAVQSQRRGKPPPSASPRPAAQLGFVRMSNKAQPHASHTHSTGTFGSQGHSHIHAGWFAGQIAGRLCPGHIAEQPTCHAATGISRAAR